MDKSLDILEKEIKSTYTGYTCRCRICGEDIKSTYIGKEDNGITPIYFLSCGCKEKKDD